MNTEQVEKLDTLLSVAFQRAIDYGMAVAIQARDSMPQTEYVKQMSLVALGEYQRARDVAWDAVKEELNK